MKKRRSITVFALQKKPPELNNQPPAVHDQSTFSLPTNIIPPLSINTPLS
ncbi:MAG: hypothetical protein JXR32_03760 [Anaerolineaceae bacterium]|nr:hypothetical protein [Anaerolineaceae bacterium]